MKYYDFIDKAPKIGGLVIVEGNDRLFADAAIAVIVERLLPGADRDLNLETFAADSLEIRAVAAAVSAMPFLAERRVVVVRNGGSMRAQPRRDLWAVAQNVPAGNTLVLEDLTVTRKGGKVESFGSLAGRSALRIDTAPGLDARARFVDETLTAMGASAEPRVIAALAQSDADLATVRTDLEKLALLGGRITFAQLEEETLTTLDPKAYRYASSLVEGRGPEAFAIAQEMFEKDARGAAVPLMSALATEFDLLWTLTQPGLEVQARDRWRAGKLAPIARRLGERRARRGFELAVRGFEAVVTGRAEDPRAIVDIITAELSTNH